MHVLVKRERRRLFYAQPARPNSTVKQSGGRDFRRAFIFLPDAHFRGKVQLLAQPSFFKPRHDHNGIALARQHQCEQSFAGSPADSGEVVQGSPRCHEQSVVFGFQSRHQFLRVLEALVKFLGGDRMDP